MFQETLDDDVTLEFSTPTISVVKYHPKEGLHRLAPVLFIAFDQLIDHQEILKTIRFFTEERKMSVHSNARLATDTDIAQDKIVAVKKQKLVLRSERNRNSERNFRFLSLL